METVNEPDILDPAAQDMFQIRNAMKSPPTHGAYFYGVLRSAYTAKAVQAPGFVAMEMGVATGRGLLALADIARIVGDRLGLKIHVVGFDSGEGLPLPNDVRDVPYGLSLGDYKMDVDRLRSQLAPTTELILGDVAETVPQYMDRITMPVGFVSNDLDFYTGTIASLRPFATADHTKVLPRIAMYFDDLFGYPYTTMNGEWAAITEFNTLNPQRMIGKIEGLRWKIGSPYDRQPWADLMYILESWDHPRFKDSESAGRAAHSL